MILQSLWKGPLVVIDGVVIPKVVFSRLKPTAKTIVRQVAAEHGLTLEELTGPSSVKPISRARHEAMWRLRQETKLSAMQIARALGRTDHTTALWGIRRHAKRIAA